MSWTRAGRLLIETANPGTDDPPAKRLLWN